MAATDQRHHRRLGANLQNLNLPLWPNGTVYNSVVRVPVAGAGVTMLNAATKTALPGQCFDDPVQQIKLQPRTAFTSST